MKYICSSCNQEYSVKDNENKRFLKDLPGPQFLWSKLQVALTALPVFGFGTFGQGYDLMVGKHSGLVS